MLKIFDKTLKEIEMEKELYCNSITLDKEKSKEICPCYVFAKDGTKVDIFDLPEEQIIRIYRQALKEYIIAKSNNELDRNGRIDSINDAFKMTEILKGHRTATYEGLKQIIKLFSPDFLNKYDMPMFGVYLSKDDIENYKILAKKLLSSFVKEKMQKVDLIAKFIEESKGNFEDISLETKHEVIEQLIKNEQSRNSYLNFSSIESPNL
ncbi:MAG: hypothetical protein EOM55_02810 [Clostridia bacterium]|nr:hypothetical protein [Clostridia bacterium]